MHLSLYRKFRPQTFEQIVRQEHVVRILKNQIESGAVGHAYLFTGPRGTGKTSVARIFARAVNCEHPQNGSPCGVCPSCKALAEGSLDVTEIDAASNNGVAEMRDLREKVQYPPVSGKYKVYIVDEVHMLTDSAFNALLKTLEEPPAHAIFILATTEPQKIPATILSRCMRLDFKLIPEEDLERHLASILKEIGKPYEEEAVAAIARAGAGSDRDMLSIAEACIVYADTLTYEAVTAVLGAADFHETVGLVRAMLTQNMPEAIGSCERILGEGKAVGVLLKDILATLNRVTVAKTCRNAERLLSLPKELFAEIKSVADEADGRAILRATEILIETESELRFVSSPRIALETAILRVSYPEADLSVDALLVRLNALEEKIKEGAVTVTAPAPVPVPTEAPSKAAPKRAPEPAATVEEELPPPPEEPVFEEFVPFESPEAPAKPAEQPKEQPRPSERIKDTVERRMKSTKDLLDEFARESAGLPTRREPAPKAFEKAPEPVPQNPPQTVPSVQDGAPMSADMAYGKFMRLLRKTSRSGVLFTMCSDLAASYEGETLVLTTESETVMRTLSRAEHRATMEGVFSQLGISAFEVRLQKAAPAERSAIEELKQNFKDFPIEIK